MKNFVVLDLETTGLTPKRKRSGSAKYSENIVKRVQAPFKKCLSLVKRIFRQL